MGFLWSRAIDESASESMPDTISQKLSANPEWVGRSNQLHAKLEGENEPPPPKTLFSTRDIVPFNHPLISVEEIHRAWRRTNSDKQGEECVWWTSKAYEDRSRASGPSAYPQDVDAESCLSYHRIHSVFMAMEMMRHNIRRSYTRGLDRRAALLDWEFLVDLEHALFRDKKADHSRVLMQKSTDVRSVADNTGNTTSRRVVTAPGGRWIRLAGLHRTIYSSLARKTLETFVFTNMNPVSEMVTHNNKILSTATAAGTHQIEWSDIVDQLTATAQWLALEYPVQEGELTYEEAREASAILREAFDECDDGETPTTQQSQHFCRELHDGAGRRLARSVWRHFRGEEEHAHLSKYITTLLESKSD